MLEFEWNCERVPCPWMRRAFVDGAMNARMNVSARVANSSCSSTHPFVVVAHIGNECAQTDRGMEWSGVVALQFQWFANYAVKNLALAVFTLKIRIIKARVKRGVWLDVNVERVWCLRFVCLHEMAIFPCCRHLLPTPLHWADPELFGNSLQHAISLFRIFASAATPTIFFFLLINSVV